MGKKSKKPSRRRALPVPTYFTPIGGKNITIRYVLFVDPDDYETNQDILNYRTRKYAEKLGVEWFSEVGLGKDGSRASIYLHHEETDVVIECAKQIVDVLRKQKNVRFLPDNPFAGT